MRFYVGHRRSGAWAEVFKAEVTPTRESHGATYYAVTGPFRTRRGAGVLVDGGAGNPHTQTVSECERIARTRPS